MVLRSIIFNILFYTSILFFGLLFLPALVSKNLTAKSVSFWAKLTIYSLKKIINIEIEFQNNYLIEKKGALIAANHKSAFETIYFLAVYNKVIYIVKKELQYLPIYGWYAARLGNIFLDRNRKIESIKKLSKNIKGLMSKGYKVVIFPEGTRQPENKIGEMKPGIFLIQSILKEPIYPIYIRSGGTWPKKSFIKYKKKIFLIALKPIKYGLSKFDLKKKLKTNFETLENIERLDNDTT